MPNRSEDTLDDLGLDIRDLRLRTEELERRVEFLARSVVAEQEDRVCEHKWREYPHGWACRDCGEPQASDVQGRIGFPDSPSVEARLTFLDEILEQEGVEAAFAQARRELKEQLAFDEVLLAEVKASREKVTEALEVAQDHQQMLKARLKLVHERCVDLVDFLDYIDTEVS